MLWKSLLKKNQSDFIVPPGFSKCTIISQNNRCVYEWEFKTAFKCWTVVNSDGLAVRSAEQCEIFEQFSRYPKINCYFLKAIDTDWIVVYNLSLYRLREVPAGEVPKSFQPIIARRYGGVLIYHSYDFRYMQPWYIDDALVELNKEELSSLIPKYLNHDQKFAYTILLEEEKKKRIPPTEKRIKDILSKENANLVNLRNRRDGYSIEFHYEGRRRSIVVREDLMLLDAGMCLEGMDKHFSLDSFLSILKGTGK